MSPDKVDLYDLTYEELAQDIELWGQPRFRAKQIWTWLYHSLVAAPEQMSNLPQDLRAMLSERASVGGITLETVSEAEDAQASKALFRAADGQVFEAVLMRFRQRNSVCVSSQVGCALGCSFCATGQRGFVRDLSAGEIVEQVVHLARQMRQEGAAVTNVVFMGMGEPLLNWAAVWKAVTILNHPAGLALGARRITLSTAGIVPGIERLTELPTQVRLAVSLHATSDDLRNKLVPVNKRYPLGPLLAACRRYCDKTGRRITFEYALANGVNDSDRQARKLVRFLQGLVCHVNLIPLNPTPGCAYAPSTPERVRSFQVILQQEGIATTVRLPRGTQIAAGCGQLRGAYLDAITADDEEAPDAD